MLTLLTTSTGRKLKRRLEDLERCAASFASPEVPHAEIVEPPKCRRNKVRSERPQVSRTTENKAYSVHAPAAKRPASYDCYATTAQDERGLFGQQCTRQLSASPPPVFSHAQPARCDANTPIYWQMPMNHSDIWFAKYGEHIPSEGSMLSAQTMYRKPDEDMVSPFGMGYATMAGIELVPQQHAEQSLLVQSS